MVEAYGISTLVSLMKMKFVEKALCGVIITALTVGIGWLAHLIVLALVSILSRAWAIMMLPTGLWCR